MTKTSYRLTASISMSSAGLAENPMTIVFWGVPCLNIKLKYSFERWTLSMELLCRETVVPVGTTASQNRFFKNQLLQNTPRLRQVKPQQWLTKLLGCHVLRWWVRQRKVTMWRMDCREELKISNFMVSNSCRTIAKLITCQECLRWLLSTPFSFLLTSLTLPRINVAQSNSF